MKRFLIVAILFYCTLISAQHEPGAWVLGVQGAAKVDRISDFGGGVQVHYAPNCFTSYITELNLINTKSGVVPEIGVSVNSIMFNFKSWMITGGMGFVVNNAKLTEEEKKDAIFSFTNAETSFGALLKVRTLIPLTKLWQMSSEFNFKTVGGNFSTVTLGLIYELPLNGY